MLDAPGVTLDRLRAFADAAAACRAREIWHDIGPDDLVLVESPAPPDGMAGFVADFGDGDPSIRFYSSREEFDLDDEHANHEDDEDFDDEGEFDAEDGFDADGEPPEDGWHVEFVHLHELPVARRVSLGRPGPAGRGVRRLPGGAEAGRRARVHPS